MADSTLEYAFFYNSEDGDRVYDASSFEYWLKKFFTSGVFADECQVTADGTGMTCSMAAGYANVEGKVKFWDEAQDLALETANAAYDRIDAVVIERNDSDRDITVKVVTGTYAASPVAPEPEWADGVYQLVIAQIYVAAGTTAITQANITDTRTDTDLCGYVASTVDEIDFSQFQAQFEAYLAEFETDNLEAFETWFANIKDQLSTDAAGALQTEIDELSATVSTLEETVNTTLSDTVSSLEESVTSAIEAANEMTDYEIADDDFEDGFASYSDEQRPRVTRLGSWVQLTGIATPTEAVTGSTTELNVFVLPDWAIPKRDIFSLHQGTTRNLFWLRIYGEESANNTPGMVTVSRYRNETGFTSMAVGCQLTMSMTWIAADAYDNE